jgi:ABC-type phosphate/phosphonate transport system substrate-binding protein
MLERLKSIVHVDGLESFFSRLNQLGTHLQSIALVAAGMAGAGTVDSNALRLELRRHPDYRCIVGRNARTHD